MNITSARLFLSSAAGGCMLHTSAGDLRAERPFPSLGNILVSKTLCTLNILFVLLKEQRCSELSFYSM